MLCGKLPSHIYEFESMTQLIMHEILVKLDSIYKKVDDESLEQKDLKNLAQLKKAF